MVIRIQIIMYTNGHNGYVQTIMLGVTRITPKGLIEISTIHLSAKERLITHQAYMRQ